MPTERPLLLAGTVIRRGLLPIVLLSGLVAAAAGAFAYRREASSRRERLAYQVETMVASLEFEWVHGNYSKVGWQLQQKTGAEFIGLYDQDCRLVAAVPSNRALAADTCAAALRSLRGATLIDVRDPTGGLGHVVAAKPPFLLPILVGVAAPILAAFLIPIAVYYFALRKALGDDLLAEIRGMLSKDRLLPPTRYREFEPVYLALQEHEQRNRALIEQIKENEFKATLDRELAQQAAQVAHDIRSPLAALRSAVPAGPEPPEAAGDIIRRAVDRIHDIADDLLSRHRSEAAAPPTTAVRVAPAVTEAFDEFQARQGLRQGLQAALSISEASQEDWALVSRTEFLRIASNLLNNAGEAARTRVAVALSQEDSSSSLIISLSDDGPGIPPDILPKLGQRGATFGKPGGTGLGLWHAKTTVESWGGRLEIESEPGKGTTVRLILPRAEPPAGPEAAVLLDDDPLVRMNWTMAAKRAGKRLKAYADPGALIKEAADIPKDTPIYIDSDLGAGLKGEDAAKELSALGYTRLHLATGHDPASFPPLPHISSIQGKEPPWPSA